MRWILALLLTLAGAAQADDLIVLKMSGGQVIAVNKTTAGSIDVLGVFDSVTVIGSETPTPQPNEPTGEGQLICVRPWSCTLDESDADLTIRESLDAAKSKVPYFRLLPITLNQQMQPHPADGYRSLVSDPTKAWCFHVVPTAGQPAIQHQGPLDADVVLGWVGVKKIALADEAQPDEVKWLDVDFEKVAPQALGMVEPPAWLQQWFAASATNVRSLPGFMPIPKAEWSQWTARFPVTRLAKSIRNTTEQTMGSCVGHACANGVEAGEYMLAGDPFFRRISGMSMYVRIGRSPGSGAYIPDAADEVFNRGILPVTGQGYPHEFPQDTDFYRKLPDGWESTATAWKAAVYTVDDQESAFRVLMDLRLRNQIGRSSHSISQFAVTASSKWAYENSWGTDWGDLGKSVGYDSRFYNGYVYAPVLRDEIPILLARELDSKAMMTAEPTSKESPHLKAYRHFDEELQKIKAMLEEIQKWAK